MCVRFLELVPPLPSKFKKMGENRLDDFVERPLHESHRVGLATPKTGFTVRSHATVLRTTTLGAGAWIEGGEKLLLKKTNTWR